jgi:acetylornithine deacetylase/succinyl-diaminopimelate desuccinylase-like protein
VADERLAGPTAARSPVASDVASLMPELEQDLARLVAIPSVSAPDFPAETRPALLEAYETIVGLFRGAGFERLSSLELPNTAPIVTGEIPAPEGAPTVLLYSHYDVVGAGDEAEWDSPPFEASLRDGAIYGRGTADSKSNILVHLGALRAWGGRPPVGVRLLLEGQEEVGSVLEAGYPSRHPDQFAADALLIADGGNIRPGEPSLTVSIRGDAAVTVEVRTLASAKHSGQYGGAAPDALIVLLHALASLHDEHGDVAKLNIRIHPEQDAGEAQAAVIRHLEAQRPFGVPLVVHAGDTGNGYRGRTDGPVWDAMVGAMEAAWGHTTVQVATGGAIPLVQALSDGVPAATVLLFGTTDKFANIHGPNERVLVDEFEKAVLAETLFFQELASRWEEAR